MVLVDTSVWIRALARRAPYAGRLRELLIKDQVSGHEFVYGELMVGDTGQRDDLLIGYLQMHLAATVPHKEVVEFVRKRRLQRRRVGWIDVHLLASAVVGGMKLWTADLSLFQVARELDVSFE